jgi:glycosyltransferase involved in cell wall biosynthesis
VSAAPAPAVAQRAAAPDGEPTPGGVVVVMSTYNGARFVEEQVRSIQGQSFAAWTLLVRDDGSSDETPAIVARLAAADARVRLLPPDGRNLGAAASFGVLLAEAHRSGAGYVFLADQDDVWLPEKLDALLGGVAVLEREHGAHTPLLVHSDLEVVDEELRPISPSFVGRGQDSDGGAWRLGALLVQNVVTGCAAVVNRALLDVAVPFPEVAMHDWWLAQCAAATGRIRLEPVVTVRYRQHGRNVVGAKSLRGILQAAARHPGAWWARGYRNFVGGLGQIAALHARLASHPAPTARPSAALTGAYLAALGRPTAAGRVSAAVRLGVGPRSALFYVLFLARVAVYRPR